MILAPLTGASGPIQLHPIAAMGAFVFGMVQLAGPKGTLSHGALGYTWVALMVVVAVSSSCGSGVCGARSTFTLAMLPAALGMRAAIAPRTTDT